MIELDEELELKVVRLIGGHRFWVTSATCLLRILTGLPRSLLALLRRFCLLLAGWLRRLSILLVVEVRLRADPSLVNDLLQCHFVVKF